MPCSKQYYHSSNPSTTPRFLHILILGDSLTTGKSSNFLPYHPYSIALQRSLEDQFPGSKVKVDVEGLPGDRVGGWFEERLKRRLEQTKSSPYTHVLILGGYNDLNQSSSPTSPRTLSALTTSLRVVYELAASQGATVVGMTMLEFEERGRERLIKGREGLNKWIESYKRPGFYLYPLDQRLPYHSLTLKQREELWAEDGVHLTARGYDVMGWGVGGWLGGLINDGTW